MQNTPQKSEPQSSTKEDSTEPVSTEKESQGSVAVATEPENRTDNDTEASTETEDNTKSRVRTSSSNARRVNKNNNKKNEGSLPSDSSQYTADDMNKILKGKVIGKGKSEKALNRSAARGDQDQIRYHQKAIKDYDMEIAAAEGKSAMMAKLGEIRRKREEHIKALKELQG